MNLLLQKMNWQIAKGERLNQNIAHIDMPGYRRVDIAPFEKVLRRDHETGYSLNKLQNIETSEEITRENEVMRLTEVVSDYQANMQIYKKYLGLLKTIIGKTSM